MKVTHLIVDAVCFTERIADKKSIRKIIEAIPKIIQMKTLIKPVVISGKTLPGISGIVIIETSHIAIHTFTAKDYVNIDVFSCKPFNPDKVVNYLKKELNFKKYWVQTVAREL